MYTYIIYPYPLMGGGGWEHHLTQEHWANSHLTCVLCTVQLTSTDYIHLLCTSIVPLVLFNLHIFFCTSVTLYLFPCIFLYCVPAPGFIAFALYHTKIMVKPYSRNYCTYCILYSTINVKNPIIFLKLYSGSAMWVPVTTKGIKTEYIDLLNGVFRRSFLQVAKGVSKRTIYFLAKIEFGQLFNNPPLHCQKGN